MRPSTERRTTRAVRPGETEVVNYVAALGYGTRALIDGAPLTNRLIREVHARLLSVGRGADRQAGEFRPSQNWIGGTRPGNAHYVPPPPGLLADCMADLERFLNDGGADLGPLIRAAVGHAQFESIHPLLDGNGRVGRLLVALLLHHDGVLRQPLLYLSLHLKQHRDEYYRLHDTVRAEGDWEAWIDFFLEGVEQTATGAMEALHRLIDLFRGDAERVRGLERAAANALRVHDALRARPVTTLRGMAAHAQVSFTTAARATEALCRLGIAREVTGRARKRVFVYRAYLDILNEGGEPL